MIARIADVLDRLPDAVFAGVVIIATFAGVILACVLIAAIWAVGRTI